VAIRTLQKWHGAGNDFLVDVVEHGNEGFWTPALAREVLERQRGVGGDGLLIASVGSGRGVGMMLFNADGSRAEMSGNGIRCLVAAVRRATGLEEDEVRVMTDAGERVVRLHLDGDDGFGSVEMGEVSVLPTPEGALGAVRVGNPHVVVAAPDHLDLESLARRAEEFSSLVGGANVEFIREREGGLDLVVHERGVGWTLACGTGSVASAYVAHHLGWVGSEVVVRNPGGSLEVSLEGERARLAGPVSFVANVEWLAR
jgi:diaminopimelate epimerase